MFYEFHIGTLTYQNFTFGPTEKADWLKFHLVTLSPTFYSLNWQTTFCLKLPEENDRKVKKKSVKRVKLKENTRRRSYYYHRENMTFNGVLVVSVAKVSAEIWQLLACLPEPISSQQLLDLVICFPLQQIGRLALCVCTFLCFPPTLYSYQRYSHTTSTSSSHNQNSDDSSLSSSSSSSRLGQNWVDFDLIIWSPCKVTSFKPLVAST